MRSDCINTFIMLLYITLYVTVSMVTGEGQKSGSGESVGCFTCHSYNNSDPNCKDPFSPHYSTYDAKCKSGMEGRVGGFPSHFCIKMHGYGVDDGVELTVRTCALKSMHNQCGTFEFEGVQYSGCLTTCDKSGCNKGSPSYTQPTLTRTALLTLCTLTIVKMLTWDSLTLINR